MISDFMCVPNISVIKYYMSHTILFPMYNLDKIIALMMVSGNNLLKFRLMWNLQLRPFT